MGRINIPSQSSEVLEERGKKMLSRTQVEKVQWLETSLKNYVVEEYCHMNIIIYYMAYWHILLYILGTYVWYFIAILLFKIKNWYIIFYYLWSIFKFKEMIIKTT